MPAKKGLRSPPREPALERKEAMLKRREKVFYGLGDFASNIAFGSVSFYLMYFMVKVGGLEAGLAGVVFIIAKFWDAVTDYFMGRISDKTKCKFGKRRIYMLCGAVPFGLSFILLWLIPGTNSQALKFLYYTGMYMLFCTCWTVVYVPYNTLSANMTSDYDERTSLTSFRIVLANLGILIGAAVFSLLAEGEESLFYGLTGSQAQAYLLAGVCFAVLAIVLTLLCTLNVKERVDDGGENTYGFFSTLKQLVRLKEFRASALLYLLSMLGFDVVMAIYMFYVSDTLGFGGGTEAMIFVAIPLVCAMASAPFWTWLSAKKGKVFAYNTSAIAAAVCFFFTLFVPEQSVLWLVVVSVLCGFSMSCLQIIPWAILPDVVDIDESVYGVRREGAFFGLVSFLYKLANGLGIGFVGLVLGWCGYVEGAGSYIDMPADWAGQPDSALLAIRLILACVPGIIFLISLICSKKCNFSKADMDKVHQKMEAARAERAASAGAGPVPEGASLKTAGSDAPDGPGRT